MEENSDAHMETDVSSTTEDVPEVQTVSVTHRDMETSIIVEPIKEETMSPYKNTDKLCDKKSSSLEIAKSPPTPKLVHLKKIVIKATNNTYHIQKPAMIPTTKPEETRNMIQKDSPAIPLSPSRENKNVVDSSSKAGHPKSPEKSVACESTQKGPAMEVEITVEKSPTEDTAAQESNTALDKFSLNGPVKEIIDVSTADKEKDKKTSTVKEQPELDVTPSNENKKVPDETKQDLGKTPSSSPVKSTTKPLFEKEQMQKQTPKNISKPVVITRKELSNKLTEKILDTTDDPAVSTCSTTPLLEDKEASNDSQIETNSESSEKDHNKSISRELRSLIKSAKESKIISECTQLTSKTRKSRTLVDANTSVNTPDADKIHGFRRASVNSQASNSSEKSDRTPKRSMRSQNPEFVSKVKNFLSSVSGKVEVTDDETESKAKDTNVEFAASTPKKKKENEYDSEPVKKSRSDSYCWRCHWPAEPGANEKVQAPLECTVCPRSFHFKCLTVQERSKIQANKSWVCPECLLVLQAENSDTRSLAMKKVSLGMLCELLKYALERMKDVNGVEPFLQPVDRAAFPDYDTYVIHPMDLSLMEAHINEGYYGSTEAFLTDAHWILHNSIIFNTLQSKLTGGARALVRSCRAEMGEIEACPECYAAAHARRPTWFTDVCSTPHVLLWAKLKGFPYWPAKAMTVNSSGMVDVRFFGQHDRAWVPARDCFLYSEKDPNNFRTKRQDLLDSMQEAEQHIRNISRKYGKFIYPPFRTAFDTAKLTEQLKMMIPSFEGEVRSQIKEKQTYSPGTPHKEKSRSDSKSSTKSSKESHQEGEASECEESAKAPTHKSANIYEIPLAGGDQSDNDKIMEVDKVVDTPTTFRETRKRRQSLREEAVTDTSKDKKKRVDNIEKTVENPSITNKEASAKTTTAAKEKPKDDSLEKQAETTPSPLDKDKKFGNKQATIRVISIAKVLNTAIKANPKDTPKPKSEKTPNDKETSQDEKPKALAKRRKSCKSNTSSNSSSNSLNSSITTKSDKETPSTAKDTPKDTKTMVDKKADSEKKLATYEKPKPSKSRIVFDDDVSLAELAKKTGNNQLPTISNVRSISSTVTSTETAKAKTSTVTTTAKTSTDTTTAKSSTDTTTAKTSTDTTTAKTSTETTTAKTTTAAKSAEVTVVTPSQSSVFTPTAKQNVTNMKEAADKLQKLRNESDPPIVGRVGVRAFARMTSPPKETATTNEVQIEIKAEPIDFDDADRQIEKMDLMNAITLQPVNPPANNLREVRISKVVVGPLSRKQANKPVEIRPKAKKSFPQPKMPEEGRSELTSKNSMVYIPIQPPMSQAPTRMQRPPNGPVSMAQGARTSAAVSTTPANVAVNTVTTPLASVNMTSLPSPTVTPNNTVAVPTVGNTVHTVPLITSLNGQWTFSLQPMMSVGGVDSAKSPAMVNGLPERALQVSGAGPAAPVMLGGGSVLQPIAPAVAPNTRPGGDNPPREPPRLQQRPGPGHPLDPAAPPGPVLPPSAAGPLTAKLNQNAGKLANFFRTLLEDTLEKLDDPVAQLATARVQLEQARWRHQQEIDEIKHNHELTLAEMRAAFEKDKVRLVAETRRAAQADLEAAVKHAKSKQCRHLKKRVYQPQRARNVKFQLSDRSRCAKCSQEAQFYCCWNTSYCDYPCQRAHWAQHYAVCAQQRAQDNSEGIENRLQPAPDHLPKTTAAPNLTVGGKLAPSRVYTQEMSPKNSIIMSMVEEGGTQTMKCVGTYKPSASNSIAPLIINKQMLNNEDAAKKVVTSGGYLIVGAANAPNAPTSTASVVPTGRRVQYYS